MLFKEDIMRKLMFALAAVSAVLSTGATTSRSDAAMLGAPGGLRGAIEDNRAVDQVRLVCTHWWNGRFHRQAVCFVRNGHRHHRRWR